MSLKARMMDWMGGDIGNLLMHYRTYFFIMVMTSLKKKNGKVKRGGEHAFFKKVQREGHVII